MSESPYGGGNDHPIVPVVPLGPPEITTSVEKPETMNLPVTGGDLVGLGFMGLVFVAIGALLIRRRHRWTA
jgi:LPXTG-motif cell wall-anchored protein